MRTFYEMTAEQAADELAKRYPSVERIDSPLQNLSLYRDLMENGSTRLPGVSPASKVDLGAIFLGSASDKTLPITSDSVTAVNAMLGVTMPPSEAQALAGKADAVRAGLLAGHGE
jgi:hypothetical protein